jgi:hypothetical protein
MIEIERNEGVLKSIRQIVFVFQGMEGIDLIISEATQIEPHGLSPMY